MIGNLIFTKIIQPVMLQLF